MGVFNHWPYLNLHELNLDMILQEVKRLFEETQDIEKTLAILKEEMDDFIHNPEIQQIIIDEIRKLAEEGKLDDLFMYEVDSPLDLKFEKSSNYDGFDIHEDIKLDMEKLTLDNVKVKGLSLKQVFEDGALVQNGTFVNGDLPIAPSAESVSFFGPHTIISSDVYYADGYSMHFRTTPEPAKGSGVLFNKLSNVYGHLYFGAFKALVTRFHHKTAISGTEGVTWGFWRMPYSNPANETRTFAPKDATYGRWETYSEYIESDYENIPAAPGIGVVSQYGFDSEGFIDCIVYTDLTALYGANPPSQLLITFAYDIYCEIKRRASMARYDIVDNSRFDDYSDQSCFDKFIEIMNEEADLLGLENATIISSAGGLLEEGVFDTSTVKDMAKWGLHAFSNPKLQRYLNMPITRINWWRGRTNSISIENGYIANQYQEGGPRFRFPIMMAKGGSLSGDYNLRNVCCYGSLENNATYLVGIMGMTMEDNYNNIIDAANKYAYLSLAGLDPTDTTRNPQYPYMMECINREENPIEVISMGFGNGSLNPGYAYMPWATLEGEVFVWTSPNAATSIIKTASTLKLLTASIVADFISDPMEEVTIKDFDIVPGSGSVLQPGDIVTVDMLLRLLLMLSDNDAATALARHVGHKMLSAR